MSLCSRRAAFAALCLAMGGFAHDASALEYDVTQSYPGDCVVTHKGGLFHAKWWANPGQSPDEVFSAAHPWDTPWEVAATGTPTGCPDENTSPPAPGPNPGDGAGEPGGPSGQVKLSSLLADEAAMVGKDEFKPLYAVVATLDNLHVESVVPGRPENPANVKRVEAILPEDRFNAFFPLRAPEYSYAKFLQAVAKFPAVCGDYDDGRDAEAICRKTLATMFAHFAQETGGHESWRDIPEWRQGLVYVREMGWSEDASGGYNAECSSDIWAPIFPCGRNADGSFKSYFGRGAKQLSYSFNYGPFSQAMYGDVSYLLDNPHEVANSWLNLASATFFLSYPQPPKPSMLHVIDGTWVPSEGDRRAGRVPGFGVTTMIMNGGVECGGPTEHAQSQNRINYYREFARELGVPVPEDEVLGCKGMKVFDESSSGSVAINWDEDWNAPGQARCQLVGWQTGYTVFNTGRNGDYVKCIRSRYPNVEIVDDLK